MQRQGALADSTLAGADGDEMADPGQPVGDAGTLLDDLLAQAAVRELDPLPAGPVKDALVSFADALVDRAA